MARQEVTRFFQKLKLPEPKFETTQIDGNFHCKLSWQGAELSKGALTAQAFLGTFTLAQIRHKVVREDRWAVMILQGL